MNKQNTNGLLATPNQSKRLSTSDGKFGGVQIKVAVENPNSQSKDVFKVAIEVNYNQHLYELNKQDSLLVNILDFCKRHHIANPEKYALKNDDTKLYITESNRFSLRDGLLLKLVLCPSNMVSDILQGLKPGNGDNERATAISNLIKESKDPTFSEVFIRNGGLKYLVDQVESGKLPKEDIRYILSVILEIIEQNLIDLDLVFTSKFVKYVSGLITNEITGLNVENSDKLKTSILSLSLGIVEVVVINSKNLFSAVAEEIKIPVLVSHLQNSDVDVQQATVALINGILLKSSTHNSKLGGINQILDSMVQKQFRTIIKNNIIRSGNRLNTEMTHQLYVLQCLTINTMEQRMQTKITSQMFSETKNLHDIYLLACDSINQELPKKQSNAISFDTKNLRKLGFTNLSKPLQDFEETPPGLLSLDFMHHFAFRQTDVFNKLILENNSREEKLSFPFVKSSIYITKVLCNLLKIGNKPTEVGNEFHAMLFSHDHPVKELFCLCIVLFMKTWKEMNAIKEDFQKVLDVVESQIKSSLEVKPQTLDQFRQKLPSYSDILKKREQELADKEDEYSKSASVKNLRKKLELTILSTIKSNRMCTLRKGTLFHKIDRKRREHKNFWRCRLSENGKYLQYGDAKDNAKDDISQSDILPENIALSNISQIITDRQHQVYKNMKNFKVNSSEYLFSLVYNNNELIHFLAPNMSVCADWIDGLKALRGEPMDSWKFKQDYETLMRMDVKLQLLELESVKIPDKSPSLPKTLPKDYNFALTNF